MRSKRIITLLAGISIAAPLAWQAAAERPQPASEHQADKPQVARHQRQRDRERPRLLDEESVAEARGMNEAHRQEMRQRNQGFIKELEGKTPHEVANAMLEHANENFALNQTFRNKMHQHRMERLDKQAAEQPEQAETAALYRARLETRHAEVTQQTQERHQAFVKELTAIAGNENLTHEDLREFRRQMHRSERGPAARTGDEQPDIRRRRTERGPQPPAPPEQPGPRRQRSEKPEGPEHGQRQDKL